MSSLGIVFGMITVAVVVGFTIDWLRTRRKP